MIQVARFVGCWLCVVACVGAAVCCSAAPDRAAASRAFAGDGIGYNLPGYNYDEAKVPPYSMLDPLRMADDTPVTTPQQWWDLRRPQIVTLFQDNIYGRTPATAEHTNIRVEPVEQSTAALDGLASRKQVDLIFGPTPAPGAHTAWRLRLLLYVPSGAHGPVPVIFGLNFKGNQSVADDPGIRPTDVWTFSDDKAPVYASPAAETWGSHSSGWQVKTVLSRGYGLATAYYQDLEPDATVQRADSVRALFDSPGAAPAVNTWGALAAWAWGYQQAVAYLQTDPAIDAKHIAVTGHSLLGKAADWAAATNPQIAALLSTESGKGGQSLQRRDLGETVEHLDEAFPHWFCPAYGRWIGHDKDIPADGNLLVALMAPRPVYVASAHDDRFGDPKGEFLSARSASTVYTLLGAKALAQDAVMPAVDQPIGLDGDVAYHVRSGVHEVTAFDWARYLDFLDAHWGVPARR